MAARKVLIVHARLGEILESRVVEGDIYEIVKEVAREALEKWDPRRSDFVAMRFDKEWTLLGDEPESLVRELEELGLVREKDGRRVAVVPFFQVSYDTWTGLINGKEQVVARATYYITLYIDEAYRLEVERDAADLTAEALKYQDLEEGEA